MKTQSIKVLGIGALVVGLLSVVAAAGRNNEKPSVESLPPVVVQTVPQAGDTNVVAADVKEICVTFSKKMTDKSWSWSQISDDTFPRINSDLRYEADGKTCVCPVALEPGRTYAFWLNSQKFHGFKDAGGMSAVPYLLVFETK